MYENFHVQLEKKINFKDDIEVNNQTRRNLINNNTIGLSYYELCCKPREIKDVNKINFEFKKIDRIIKETLRCTICLQIFQEPVNMKNCLHKFCKKCIEEYNRRIKKECASCRHPIETRRLLREDNKIKEIINCLIPNLEKFNEIEDQIIKKFIPQYYFKDNNPNLRTARKQSNNSTNEMISNNLTKSFSVNTSGNEINESHFTNKYDSDTLLNGKKRQREKTNNKSEENESNNNHNIFNNSDSILINSNFCLNDDIKHNPNNIQNHSGFERNKDVEVKLICDLPNEEIKKIFSKSKIYTNENITLEYFSKYICFKQNLRYECMNKIIFYTYDEFSKKIDLPQEMTLKTIVENSKFTDGVLKIHFNYI